MAKRLTDDEVELLRSKAKEAFGKSQCTYSKFGVGCAIMLNDNRCICGFNIENSAYSVTICAERVAMVSAISQYGVTSKISRQLEFTLNHLLSVLLVVYVVNSYMRNALRKHLYLCLMEVGLK